MFSKFNTAIDTIFLDSHSDVFLTEAKVNIVVSPSLYWVKKVSLPVKYIREVKPLLPSLFEEILPDGNYSYYSYKKEDYFYIFAYEDKVILDTLKEKSISLAQINNVYFSQSEFEDISTPIKIDENQSLYKKDELIILLPSALIESDEVLDVRKITLSKHSIKLNQFSHIVNNKSLYTVMGIFVLLICLVSIEYFIVNKKTFQTLELRDELFTKNSLKSTMFQNRSMLKEYESIHTRQMKFRKYIESILSLKLAKTQKLSLLSFKANTLVAEFRGIPKGSEKKILQVLKNKGLNFKTSFKENTLQMELDL